MGSFVGYRGGCNVDGMFDWVRLRVMVRVFGEKMVELFV